VMLLFCSSLKLQAKNVIVTISKWSDRSRIVTNNTMAPRCISSISVSRAQINR
jgi:hypothetical protein